VQVKRLLERLFRKKQPPAPPPPPPPPPPSGAVTYDFTELATLPADWKVSTWTAPGGNPQHSGLFKAANVTLSPEGLRLKLTQRKLFNGTIASEGGEVTLMRELGHGTYTWVAKATSPCVSGSVMGLFNYRTGSETEIDIEVEGELQRSSLFQFTTWKGESQPNEHHTYWPPVKPSDAFHELTFKWYPDKCEFLIDGVLRAIHLKVVPTLSACPMMNHWGTHNPNWGGLATLDVERFVIIRSFSFTPL
jgi:hypothetical protein